MDVYSIKPSSLEDTTGQGWEDPKEAIENTETTAHNIGNSLNSAEVGGHVDTTGI
jgi:hypothetical protein